MDNFDLLLKDTLALLAIDSVQSAPLPNAPFGSGNQKALDFVLNLAKNMGFTTINHDGYIGVAEIGQGEDFGILGHLDVVPIGTGWTKNPLGEIADGNIYGRGILDNKGPMLSCLYATYELLKTKKPKKRIRIIFGCNEESGWGCIDHFNKVDKMPEIGFSPDADFPVINCEKGIVNFKISLPQNGDLDINGGERANVVPHSAKATLNGKTFTTCGISAHGSHPDDGDNAIFKLLDALKDEPCGLTTRLSLDKLRYFLCDTTGKALGIDFKDEVSGKLTMNLGTITSDKKSITAVIDIRYPITKTEDDLLYNLKQAFCTDCGAVITKPHFHLPLYVDKDDVLVTTLLDVYNTVAKQNLSPVSIGGGTYARALKKGVAFGPVFPDKPLGIHCLDEMVPIEQYKLQYEIYLAAIDKLCF